MVFALILMIKNEEKILKRCLESVENLVEYFCITDTGSTDNSVAIAEEFLLTRKGRVFKDEWKNFGHNRTLSFSNAREYLMTTDCDLMTTYGLLIDADMIFVQGTLKEQKLTSVGYKFIQANASMEYYNTRLIRMDELVNCVGVTHEYWECNAESISKNICFIDDRNDGGCKQDKFQRDELLLVKGLEDEPTNVRYMFYLAQTYKCLSKLNESIEMYIRRIQAGGWAEEIWYSHYMIGECYRNLQNITEFEKWMQLAYMYRPHRTESIYCLVKYFREVGQHYKAYHYIKLCENTPFPQDDVLFIETKVYTGLFDYEASIVEYYIHKERCLERTIRYMLKMPEFQEICLSNLKFSVKPLKNSKSIKLKIKNPFTDEYHSSAISVINYPYANSRFVNYLPPLDGDYRTRDGSPIQTLNAYINLETGESIPMVDQEPLFESNVKGIEDLRIYKQDEKIYFTATSFKEYSKDKISIVNGLYNLETHSLDNIKEIISPTNSSCEKNWVNVSNTDHFIYSWSPLRIGKINDNEFNFFKEIQTPPLFSHIRGSAPAISYNGELLVLVHFVEYSTPRKYYHCFIRLSTDYNLIAISLPFYFRQNSIEYCISVIRKNEHLSCFVSLNDCDPHEIIVQYSDLEWLRL